MPEHAQIAPYAPGGKLLIECACGWTHECARDYSEENAYEDGYECYAAYAQHILSQTAAQMNATGSPTGRVQNPSMTPPDCDLTRHLQDARAHLVMGETMLAADALEAALGLLKDATIERPDSNSVTQWQPFLRVPLTEETP